MQIDSECISTIVMKENNMNVFLLYIVLLSNESKQSELIQTNNQILTLLLGSDLAPDRLEDVIPVETAPLPWRDEEPELLLD